MLIGGSRRFLDETKKDVAEQRDARLRAQGAAGLGKRWQSQPW
jgi:hypothetical protein